jgi:hypothetical protein
VAQVAQWCKMGPSSWCRATRIGHGTHLPVSLISVVSENPLIIFLPFKRTIFLKNGKACVRA